MIDQAFLRSKYNPEGSELRAIQHRLMTVMIEFDRRCSDNNIPYILTGGNLLGAVRHGGFIPWDDDIDIALLKDDYRRLIKILRHYNNPKYILQEHRVDPDYINTFPKFREREGDLLGSLPQRGALYRYRGCGIDIFCMAPISKLNARISAGFHRRLLGNLYKIRNERKRHIITAFRWGLCNIVLPFFRQVPSCC